MVSYLLSPYVHFIEDYLVPEKVKHGIFHRLTGNAYEISQSLHSILLKLKNTSLEFTYEEIETLPMKSKQIFKELIFKLFVIPNTNKPPLTFFLDYYVVRPLQNPALVYKSDSGDDLLVGTPKKEQLFSITKSNLPIVIETKLADQVAYFFSLAIGNLTLRQILNIINCNKNVDIFGNKSLIDAFEYLTHPENQLIKLTPACEDLENPNQPFNTVHRTTCHINSTERTDTLQCNSHNSKINFHHFGIDDAEWQFDWMETTVSHAFRFPQEALADLSYGGRFCRSALELELLTKMECNSKLKVLEVGGGTGFFARSFIEEANNILLVNDIEIEYHILDISPVLLNYQKKVLFDINPPVTFFEGDAQKFDLPDFKFDLIIANEVIADLQVTQVQKVNKLNTISESFLVNSGACKFLDQACHHLSPNGVIIIVEYGSESKRSTPSYHLNHDEYSIDFTYLAEYAAKSGFQYDLLSLKDFLQINDQVMMLSGHHEHILCLNYILKKYGFSLPYAAVSKSFFEKHYLMLSRQIELTGISFTPLSKGFHFGPDLADFRALVLKR